MNPNPAKRPKKKKITKIIFCILLLAAVLYVMLVNFLVSAALVPSFMEKLEAFERITEESYAAQVQTSDIQVNRQLALNETAAWLKTVSSNRISVMSGDGYRLVASEFLTGKDSHVWVLMLHGYTGWKEEMYPFARWYYEEGYHVIVPDLRCQGEKGILSEWAGRITMTVCCGSTIFLSRIRRQRSCCTVSPWEQPRR